MKRYGKNIVKFEDKTRAQRSLWKREWKLVRARSAESLL